MAKATLVIDNDKAHGEHASYGCYAITKNGACPNNPAEYSVGPMKLRFCRRHYRMWQEESVRLVSIIRSEHESGLHGEGEDRKPFAEPHVRGEYWLVRCQPCQDEIDSAELGVPAEQVFEAQQIRARMMRAQDALDKAEAQFRVGTETHGLADAIGYYGDDIIKATYRVNIWLRVTQLMTDKHIGMVDATHMIADNITGDLIDDGLSDTSRPIAARWVRENKAD